MPILMVPKQQRSAQAVQEGIGDAGEEFWICLCGILLKNLEEIFHLTLLNDF